MAKIYPKIIFLSFFIFLLFFSHLAFAASLNLLPSSGSYNVGDVINVRIVLSSSDQPANAVSGVLSFSKDLFTLTSISKSNSLISLWASEPSYSNTNGTVNMEGVILNGYTGSNGTILSLFFKVKATGTANVKFTSSSVLANDGQGTNILTGTSQASFNMFPAKTKETPVLIPAPVIVPIYTSKPTTVKVLTPIFTDYSKETKEGEFFVVKGFVEPNTDILIVSDGVVAASDEIIHESKTLKSDDSGAFVYVSERAKSGVYMITAQARNKDGVFSEKTLPIKISVYSPIVSKTSASTNIINTLLIAIPIVVLLILFMIWGWRHILNYWES